MVSRIDCRHLLKNIITATEASFAITWNIFRAKRPYKEREFIKKNIEELRVSGVGI